MSKPTGSQPIMLVGGSGLGPWAWIRVAPLLRDQGSTVHTPELTRPGATASPVTLSTWVDDLLNYMERNTSARPIIVAHSFAGYIAAALLEKAPGLIEGVIFLDASIPAPGMTWFDQAGQDTATFMRTLAVDGVIPWLTDEQLDAAYPGHGLTASDLKWMRQHLTGQPLSTYDQVAIERPIDTHATKLTYARCLRAPKPLGVPAQDSGWRWRELDTGHWPMVTHPHLVADLLKEEI